MRRRRRAPRVAEEGTLFDGLNGTDPIIPPTSYAAPQSPAPPRAVRIDRNALTIAAVVMGSLVIAAVVFVQPTGAGKPHASPPPTALDGTRNTYLDRPLESDQGVAPTSGTTLGMAPADTPLAPFASSMNRASSGAPGVPGAESGLTEDAPRQDALTLVAARRPRSTAVGAVRDIAETQSTLAELRAAIEAPVTASAARPTPNDLVMVTPPPNVTGTPAIESPTMAARPHAVAPAIDSAPGAFSVHAGTVIPAVLVTEINSDLPGDVLAQVARDVYDSRTQQLLLIPKGSKLLGRYENRLGTGQERLLVAWTRIVFPDGRSLALDGLETKDGTGAGGLHDQVDRHGRRLFGTAALLSLVGAGAQLSQPNAGYGTPGSLGYPSPGQVAAGAMGQEFAQVATDMLRRNMDQQPTIRIRQGMPLNVFLTMDVVFPAPYSALTTSASRNR